MSRENAFHRMNKNLRIAFLAVLVLLSSAISQGVFAADEKQQLITVGVFPYEGQLSVDADGNYSGYGYDYLQKIAHYTGWRYRFIDASWSECLDMLERGEIDLMGSVMRSPQREEIFDFSDAPMISGYGVLATNLDNYDLPFGAFTSFDGLRVGALKSNLQKDSFLQYSQDNGFTPIILEYSTQAEMDKALAAGEIGAIIMTNVLRSQTLRVVATFGENDAYFATAKENTRIMDAVNDAMQQIRLEAPYFNSNLDQKYYDLQSSTAISFTQEELDYIKSSPTVPIVYIPDAPPVNSFNETTGAVEGIAVDICEILEKHTGLIFEWHTPSSAKEAVNMLQSGEALLLPAKYSDYDWAAQNGVMLTDSYLPGQMIMMTSGSENRQAVALYDQGSQSRIVANAISDGAQIKEYPTIIDCVDAVLSGEASLTYINSTVASYLMNTPQYSKLQSNPIYGYSADLAMAVSEKADPLLLSIINKGIRSISPTEINQIVLSQMKNNQAGSLATFLYLHPVESIIVIVSSLLVLILALSLQLHHGRNNAKKLRSALYKDSLTGYANYSLLSREAVSLTGRSPENYALIYLDIHRFKTINDTFGYEAGDQVLIATSHILNNFIESGERFARIYADTFALLLHFTSHPELQNRIISLSDKLAQLSVDASDAIKPLFCGGVYPLQRDFSSLAKACDRANYAKGSIFHPSSNTFVFYDDVIRDRVLVEKGLESSMSAALENGEFIPYYQPKVNAITEKVVGAEALVRWVHPDKGCLLPGEFLPFYEKNGFITKIDLSVFEQVCRDIQLWIQAGNQAIPVSVNFSRRHIRDRALPQRLKDIADYYNVPTNLLEVEVTETEELENMEAAVDFVGALKAFGFGISIDDYGTGYSSISFLQQLPLDTLKLDRNFLLNAMETNKAKDIMRSLVSSMHKNGIRIVCEGVETLAQKEFVINLNCRYIQGYFYSSPLSREDFEYYLLEHGTDATDKFDFIPITSFEGTDWAEAEDFLSTAMPSWVVSCLDVPGYPVQYIGPSFLEGMGYSELEFKAETKGQYINWMHPDDLSPVLSQLRSRDASQNLTLQYRLRKKDGSYVWVREINKRVITEDGRELLLSICTDISDLVAIETEKSRIIDTIPGGVGTLLLADDGPIILTGTERFYEIIGYTQEEMERLGNNLNNILCKQDLPNANESLRCILKDRLPSCECIFRFNQKDGGMRWITFRGTASYTQTEAYITVILYNSDEEMLVKKKAEISRAKLELALQLTEHATFEYNIAEKTVYSHSGLSRYGFPEGMTINVPRDMIESGFVHPDYVEEIRGIQTQISAGTTHNSYEIRVRSSYTRQDSPYVWIRVTLTTIFDEDKHPVLAVGVAEDISRQKHFEYAFQREAQYRRAFTESSLMAYEFNLTQNTIGRITGSRGFRLQQLCDTLPHPDKYSEVLLAAAEGLVFPEDRESYIRETSLDTLLKLYNNGIYEKELEYRRITPDGSIFWNSVLNYLVMDPLSGDVLGYAYHRDIHERKETEYELIERAARDPLTGIYNRATAERLIQGFLSNHTGAEYVQAFLMLDIDRFKEINDTYGHLTGDKLLMNVAKILTTQLRSDDIAARMGGDEFAVLLKNLRDENECISTVDRITKEVAEIAKKLSINLATGVSIGTAFAPRDGSDFASLYRHADQAMYTDKRKL